MSNRKAHPQFDIFTTADGSPTINLDGGEKMHSLEGAFSESLYIYAKTLEKTLKLEKDPHILSMGLGLGYNELISTAIISKKGLKESLILSFEKVDFLREAFLAWLQGEDSPLVEVYDLVLKTISSNFQVEPAYLKSTTQQSHSNGHLIIKSELLPLNPLPGKFNCVYYDAFSNETDGYLWTEEHLKQFIDEYCDTNCFFSTYAATGNLKRALKEKGFSLEKRPGFGMKRESTRAFRLEN